MNKRVVRYLNLPFTTGVIVVEVEKGSSGYKAGVDIEDIILAVNLILSNGFEPIADMNNDNLLNISDIVLIVNQILEN